MIWQSGDFFQALKSKNFVFALTLIFLSGTESDEESKGPQK